MGTRFGGAAVAVVLALGPWADHAATAAKPGVKRPPVQGTFTDHFDSFDATRWSKADGWKNGSPFDNAWRADHASILDGRLDLTLDDATTLGEPYSSGELRTNGYFGYGCYEASFKPVLVPGVVTSFFTFAGPYDNGGNGLHNEIDVEFLGNQPGRVQLNYWTNDDSYGSRNEVLIDLGFDPAAAYHRYGFKWTSRSIEWYVDGERVYTALDQASNPTPKPAESLQKIMVNAWPVDETAVLWAGEFRYPGQPLHADYEWVRHIAGEDCSILDPPQAPVPPSGDATIVLVREISLALDSRATQVIARVSVADGLGRPVAGAAVAGLWSGIIGSGDTARSTDASGVATFYSARSRATGSVRFCVSSVAGAGLEYDTGANLETCESITK
jgi:endo-1,3-1,4-beta-glycanase ExoK